MQKLVIDGILTEKTQKADNLYQTVTTLLRGVPKGGEGPEAGQEKGDAGGDREGRPCPGRRPPSRQRRSPSLRSRTGRARLARSSKDLTARGRSRGLLVEERAKIIQDAKQAGMKLKA